MDEIGACAKYLIAWAMQNGPASRGSGAGFKAKSSRAKKTSDSMYDALGELRMNAIIRIREGSDGRTLQETRKAWVTATMMGKYKYGREEAEEIAEEMFPTPPVVIVAAAPAPAASSSSSSSAAAAAAAVVAPPPPPTAAVLEERRAIDAVMSMSGAQVDDAARRLGLTSNRTTSRYAFAQGD